MLGMDNMGGPSMTTAIQIPAQKNMKASSKDAGEMKSEQLKFMKDGNASDCGDASPKLILSVKI